jgi:predicted phosphodiesterase
VRVAALYDVHGNVRALEAVLADAGAVDAYVFGGDLVWGPWPRETLDLALSLGERAHFISGNWERYILGDSTEPSTVWTRERVPLDVLRSWPETLTLDGVLYCHATPRSDEELVLPQYERSDWSMFSGPLVVCGHTHVQFDIERNGTRIVNPGSVGNPTVRSTAWWAIVDSGEDELRTTDYDTAAASEEMRTSAFPRGDFADELLEPYTVDRILEILDSAAG